ncbi:MAG: type II secretion system F family protein [Candidatus Omnitrophica bacterium]|nr:type II secretion system F family protein [Candidatus Omnitrophota bacterium]
MILIILLFVFAAVVALVLGLTPIVVSQGGALAQKNTAKFIAKYDPVLTDQQIKKMRSLILFVPAGLAVLAFLFSPPEWRLNVMILGVVLGLIIPRVQLNRMIALRKRRFNDQLMDALMIMSSSFRGGLSLIQAIEAVVDEMPDPVKQEFGIVLGENKMGVPLDESLNRLYKRTPSPGLQQMVTAILLARETGGNLALIFARIITTMRERKKIEQNLQTLTIQGKIQAVVMTGLPVLFYLGVSGSNPHFFDVMKNSPDGQKLLIACIIMWILGAISIWKISAFKDL